MPRTAIPAAAEGLPRFFQRREVIEAEIERLIRLLDLFDGDSDFEPHLAGTDGGPTDDREGDDADAEDDGTREPSLGWPALGPTQFGRHPGQLDDDREDDDSDTEPDGDFEEDYRDHLEQLAGAK